VTHLDDGVPDSISSLMVSSRDHTPKAFPCAFMHILVPELPFENRRHSPMGLRY
jgi:hypothetical protein